MDGRDGEDWVGLKYGKNQMEPMGIEPIEQYGLTSHKGRFSAPASQTASHKHVTHRELAEIIMTTRRLRQPVRDALALVLLADGKNNHDVTRMHP